MTDEERIKLASLRRESELSKKIGYAVFGALFLGGAYGGFGTAWAVGVGGLWIAYWFSRYWPHVTSGDPSPTVLALVCAVLAVSQCSSSVSDGSKFAYIQKACERELVGREFDLNHVCARIVSKINAPGLWDRQDDE